MSRAAPLILAMEEYAPSVRWDAGRARLLLAGGLWDEWDLTFCAHGEKLRWSCDDCDAIAAALGGAQ